MLLVADIISHKKIEMSENHKNLFGIDKLNVKRSIIPAVTHVDGTARPQIVVKAKDPWLHSLLCKWEIVSGELALINTSFNRHEEPIVRTYDEAFTNLENGVVDVLVLDDYLVLKA